MQKIKKRLSLLLVLCLLLGMALPAMPMHASAAPVAAPTAANDADWGHMDAVSALQPGQTYFTGNEWKGTTAGGVDNSDVFQVNREEAHSSEMIPYDSVEKAIEGAVEYSPELSGYYKRITGEGEAWQLAVYKNMDEANAAAGDFYKVGYDMAAAPKYEGEGTVGSASTAYYGGFREVTLPASWQTQGFDFPIYSNISIPWNGVYGNARVDGNFLAPTVTNPVGLYRYELDVDPQWVEENRKVFISFQGVESAMYLSVRQRQRGGLHRGQLRCPRLRHHPLPERGRPGQPDRREGHPLVRRQLLRGPGLCPSGRHLPGRLRLQHPQCLSRGL